MAYTKGEGKTTLAIFVDGLDVKFAHCSLKNKQIRIHEVKTVTLARKLEERQMISEAAIGTEGIDLAEPGADAQLLQEGIAAPQEEANTNSDAILGLISAFPSRGYQFTYAISEPSVYYQTFEDSFGLTGVKLKKRLVEELSKIRATKPDVDSVGYISAAEGQILSIIREDGMSLIELIDSVKDFIGKRIPRIPFIETSDVALMNLVRTHPAVTDEEISLIIYVGNEFSRLIFMKGREFFHFAPVISEGRTSSNIENTLYSRILLEQDSAGIMRIDRVFLAGEAHKVELRQFLAPQFSEAPIEYLVPHGVDASEIPDSADELMSEYAIPISSAIRTFDIKNPVYYDVDLLPASFREGQKVFKLAWHGYLFMALIFASTLYFTGRIANTGEDVKRAGRELTQKQLQLAENQRLQALLDSLTAQNRQYVNALAVYDSIVPNYDRWSKVFYHLTNSVEDVNSLWIRDIVSMADGTIELTGYTVYRQRIPRIANMFEKATLQSVALEEIRGKTVYRFVLTIQKLDAER